MRTHPVVGAGLGVLGALAAAACAVRWGRVVRAVRSFRVHPRRIWIEPRLGPARATEAPDTITVPVAGLVCTACAARTAVAMEAVPGVRAAHVDLASGTATVRVDSAAPPAPGALDRALGGVVVAPRARRLLARVARLRGPRRPGAAAPGRRETSVPAAGGGRS